MTRQETIKILTLLAGNFDSIANKSREQKEFMTATWTELLGDLPYEIVLKAVKIQIINSPYVPTIHTVRKTAVELMNPSENKSAIEAWSEAYKMICNGSYMTQEEFDSHSEEVKKFFGNTEQLKAYSTNTDFNLDVVRSNFLKQYDVIVKRQEELKVLPNDMQKDILKLSDQISMGNLLN